MASVLGTFSSTTSHSEGFAFFTIDFSHPFYIHPNSSSQLVVVPFSGNGIVTLRSSMLTSLSAKNKLGLIDGRIFRSTPDSPYVIPSKLSKDRPLS